MIFDQSNYNIRCEWGDKGVSLLAPISDVIIIVDILSFSISVEIATSQSAMIYPYRWRDHSAYEFARSVNAEVADRTNKNGYRLSPSSLLSLPVDTRLVLPSPNGSTLSLSTGSTPTIPFEFALKIYWALAQSLATLAGNFRQKPKRLLLCIKRVAQIFSIGSETADRVKRR